MNCKCNCVGKEKLFRRFLCNDHLIARKGFDKKKKEGEKIGGMVQDQV